MSYSGAEANGTGEILWEASRRLGPRYHHGDPRAQNAGGAAARPCVPPIRLAGAPVHNAGRCDRVSAVGAAMTPDFHGRPAMIIRTPIAAVAVTLAAVAPSFAGGYGDYGGYGYGGRTPYGAPASPYDDDTTNHLVVDGYSGRVTFEQHPADHCGPRRDAGGWTYYGYGRRVVRPDYGY